ncbi:hypothetical protein LAB1_47450 [Roseibium sp. LAB1]
MVSLLKFIFSRKRNLWSIGPDSQNGSCTMPDWLVRDLGLDDPENLKAVQVGKCRELEALAVRHGAKLPGPS